jgi:hypothetical protein
MNMYKSLLIALCVAVGFAADAQAMHKHKKHHKKTAPKKVVHKPKPVQTAPKKAAPTQAPAKQPAPAQPAQQQEDAEFNRVLALSVAQAAAHEAEHKAQDAELNRALADSMREATEQAALARALAESKAGAGRKNNGEGEQKQDGERKQTHAAQANTKSIIVYEDSLVQNGADCGYYALWNAFMGDDPHYKKIKMPLEEWRKSVMAFSKKKENIDDRDIEHLATTQLGLNLESEKCPLTIINNMMQHPPIKKNDINRCKNYMDSIARVMEKLQTKPNAHHSFVIGNAQQIGFKGKGGHWIAVQAQKKNNIITWHVKDSAGNGQNKPEATVNALINFIMQSDYKTIDNAVQHTLLENAQRAAGK